MEWYIYIIVIVVGVIVGFINTLAGGGSILSLPLLIFLGLPANIANGTNRIGVLLQSLAATKSFEKYKVLKVKDGILYAVPSVIGAIIGALFAVEIDETILKKIIAIVLIIMLFTVFYKPEHFSKNVTLNRKPTILQFIIFFIVGLYGGFIQLGVGFMYIAAFIITTKTSLTTANALKVLIITLYTFFALGIFIYNNQVDYSLGILLGIGNIIGALIATKATFKWGEKLVKAVIIITVIFSVIKLLL